MPTILHRNGAYQSGETSYVFLPRGYKYDNTKTAVIFAAGYNDAPYFAGPDPARMQPLAYAIADDLGLPVFVGDLSAGGGVYPWGNATHIARIAAARTYMQGTAVKAKAGKVLVAGFSMGALGVMNWASQNLAQCAGAALFCPVSDLAALRAQGAYQASIDTAYGGTYSDTTNGPTYNPKKLALAGAFAGLPVKAWYASNDAVVTPSTVTDNITAIGASASAVDAGALGHSWTVANNNLTAIKTFLAANQT